MTALDEFREEKDAFFGSHPQSPLTPAQKKAFKGLDYFTQNPALRLELTVERFAQPETVDFQTSTGDTQTYQRYGKLKFSVEGMPAELTLYAGEHGFFLPFVDSLANTETYGAGRYLEPELLPGGKVRVDFNLAYNPYCAYNSNWSCPLTPFENRLKVAIRAGEKLYHSEESPGH
jgi:uncharacterized protein (DUF1684 family)